MSPPAPLRPSCDGVPSPDSAASVSSAAGVVSGASALSTSGSLPTQRRSPVGAKAEQRVRDILRASRAVFAERGYERATTTEIAQRLGISEATVFTYFRGKRELCMRVIGDWYDEIIDAIESGLPRERPVRDQLEFVVHTHLRLFLIQGTGLCELVLSEGRKREATLTLSQDEGQSFGAAFVELQRRYTAPLMDLLSRGQKTGEVRQDIPLRMLRSLVFGPMEHLLWEVIIAGREIQVDRAARDLVALLWPALQAPDHELQSLRRLKAQVGAALAEADSGAR
ncbi:TetR/AcrR family transcriptional regulator [Roseateles depolymerans]|uniref:Transcriptional regulator, TetR family n=1 Tax=Roseateles depolymerans TaxID=76731 RepID=A0A0U3LUP6_9BURK|nr:TetR/AcrR family transcriptional regulator [Roseateles depolymerans]ALV08791.1 Transcriptional regulator, TetR family [Roseateles depolymerans]REG20979.1 TetR family transcriptional regulator [Roseateles depolymerans]